MNHAQIKKTVNDLVIRYQTRDPFCIACALQYQILFEHLGRVYGYFSCFNRTPLIHINRDIGESLWPFVCAHELGHSLLHAHTAGTHAFNDNSFLMNAGIEREANQFAVELLLPDEFLEDHPDMGIYNLCHLVGIPKELAWMK